MPPKAAQPAAAAPAPAKKAAAPATAAPKKAASTSTSSTGIYVGPIDVRNQTAEEVRHRFQVYGSVAQLRVKRSMKVKSGGPYVLVWFKTAEEAKSAFDAIKKGEPEGTKVEWVRSAKPTEPRSTYVSTIHINPINVPSRSSKGYGKLQQKIRALFPDAIKTRLHKENDGTGSALVYFKDNTAAKAAKAKLNGKLFELPVTVKPSCRTVEKDKKRFVAPLKEHAEFKKALQLKIAEEKKKATDTKLAAATGVKDKEMAKTANKKAFDALTAQAKEATKAAQQAAKSDAAVKAKKETKQVIQSKAGAPAKTPPARTAAKQPIQTQKTQSRKH